MKPPSPSERSTREETSEITELKIPVKLGLCKSCKQLYTDGEESTKQEEPEEKMPVKADMIREKRLVCSAPPAPVNYRELISDPLKEKIICKNNQNKSKYIPSFALNNSVRRVNGSKENYLKELGMKINYILLSYYNLPR